jgi:hypothetical protein
MVDETIVIFSKIPGGGLWFCPEPEAVAAVSSALPDTRKIPHSSGLSKRENGIKGFWPFHPIFATYRSVLSVR